MYGLQHTCTQQDQEEIYALINPMRMFSPNLFIIEVRHLFVCRLWQEGMWPFISFMFFIIPLWINSTLSNLPLLRSSQSTEDYECSSHSLKFEVRSGFVGMHVTGMLGWVSRGRCVTAAGTWHVLKESQWRLLSQIDHQHQRSARHARVLYLFLGRHGSAHPMDREDQADRLGR